MAKPLRILTVVGARPQFIKAAALGRALAGPFAGRITEVLLHTGQHADAGMSAVFFQELGMRAPDIQLTSEPGRSASLGRMMDGIERAIARERPDLALVYGDTNSTLAGALAATRTGVPVAHVEAGLRSYDNSMPEEENRVMADHASAWLFCPTTTAVMNLDKEGMRDDPDKRGTRRSPRVVMVGDVMFDNALHYIAQARQRGVVHALGLEGRAFAVATVHRASTADDPEKLSAVFAAFRNVHEATGLEVVVPMHPRTGRTLARMQEGPGRGVRTIPPLGYLDLLALVEASKVVLTDSGGLQKEASFLRRPCVILRENTEWVELIRDGGSVLAGTEAERIVEATLQVLRAGPVPMPSAFGDGHAAEHICAALLKTA
ncbi:MAG: non-hydrolyzing UDP-N-acetylglucosamine 2-epimerase [Flavobacteriales bacterium]